MAHPGGRPSKFTPERCNAILSMVEAYVPYEIAAPANGIAPGTLYMWLKKGMDHLEQETDSEFAKFVESIKKAEAIRIMDNAQTIHDRADGWQARSWLLERKHWKYFSNNAPLVELNKRLDELEAKKDKDHG